MSLTREAMAYKPFKYPWAVEFSIQSDRMFWGEWEVELLDDVNQWKRGVILPHEKHHIQQILRLFTSSDVSVAANYCDWFIPYFRNHEIRMMLLSFAAREEIHMKAYSLLNDTLGMDTSEYSVFLSNPYMKARMDYMAEAPVHSLIDLTIQDMGYLLAKAVCNEGMSLFSAFAMLMNYQRFGKMKGMCTIVDFSIKDETLHLQGMARLFKEFCVEHPTIVDSYLKKEIYSMYRHAVSLEDKIIDLSFAMGPVEGLTPEEMQTYIRYVADRRLTMLGLKPNWGIDKNPLPWLDWVMSGDSFSNFFEQRSTNYIADGMKGDWGWS